MSLKMVGKPTVGKIIYAEQELDNAVDTFAMKEVKNKETIGHLLRSTRKFCGIFSHVAEKYA